MALPVVPTLLGGTSISAIFSATCAPPRGCRARRLPPSGHHSRHHRGLWKRRPFPPCRAGPRPCASCAAIASSCGSIPSRSCQRECIASCRQPVPFRTHPPARGLRGCRMPSSQGRAPIPARHSGRRRRRAKNVRFQRPYRPGGCRVLLAQAAPEPIYRAIAMLPQPVGSSAARHGQHHAILRAAPRRAQVDRCRRSRLLSQSRQIADKRALALACRPLAVAGCRRTLDLHAGIPAQMTAIPSNTLDRVVQRWEEIQADLNRGVNPATYAQLTKEFAELNPVVETVQELRRLESERADLEQLIGRSLHREGPEGACAGGVRSDRRSAG